MWVNAAWSAASLALLPAWAGFPFFSPRADGFPEPPLDMSSVFGLIVVSCVAGHMPSRVKFGGWTVES
jgi:hypothetical protein